MRAFRTGATGTTNDIAHYFARLNRLQGGARDASGALRRREPYEIPLVPATGDGRTLASGVHGLGIGGAGGTAAARPASMKYLTVARGVGSGRRAPRRPGPAARDAAGSGRRAPADRGRRPVCGRPGSCRQIWTRCSRSSRSCAKLVSRSRGVNCLLRRVPAPLGGQHRAAGAGKPERPLTHGDIWRAVRSDRRRLADGRRRRGRVAGGGAPGYERSGELAAASAGVPVRT
jgi:hypothetical protein